MRFLLVEDEEFNLIVLEEMIKISYPDVEIITANNGQEACDILSENSFDLILSDINMPVMDGYEATKVIRSLTREDAKKVPIIAMTADAFEDDVKKALASGMNAHLAKPVSPEDLYKTLEKVLQP
jgi:CheY-like chemotaxis protein